MVVVPPDDEPTPVVVVVVVVVVQLPPEHVVDEDEDVPLDAPSGADELDVGPGVVLLEPPDVVDVQGTPPTTATPLTVPGQFPGSKDVGEGAAGLPLLAALPSHVPPVAVYGPPK